MGLPNDLTAFVRVVEKGGFSPAARELGFTPSAISKLVTRMESRLGVRLLHRTTRRLALTPEGEAFFHRASRIVADLEEAENEVARFRARPRGRLRVNSGTAFGSHQLVPALPAFLERYPEMSVELTMTDRIVDLLDEGADVGLRAGHLADSSLVSRKICDLERAICASPAYLERRGRPRRPEDLLEHNCLVIAGAPQFQRWPFRFRDGVREVAVSGNVSAGDADTLVRLAINGLGIVRLVDVVVGEAVAQGALEPILTDVHHVEPVPLHAVFPYGRQRSPRVAAFADYLIEKFSGAPWRVRKGAP